MNEKFSSEQPEQDKRPIDDMKMAKYFMRHIEAPCQVGTDPDIRYFWIDEAKKALPKMTDPEAIDILAGVIHMWEKFEETKK